MFEGLYSFKNEKTEKLFEKIEKISVEQGKAMASIGNNSKSNKEKQLAIMAAKTATYKSVLMMILDNEFTPDDLIDELEQSVEEVGKKFNALLGMLALTQVNLEKSND